MRSLKEITAVKYSINICTHPGFKEAFIIQESDEALRDSDRHSQWFEDLKKTTLKLPKYTSLPFEIQENICNLISHILRKMTHWANYNYRNFEVPIAYSRDVIKKSLFNQKGHIDYLAAVNELIKNTDIELSVRIKLVCTFKFINDSQFFREIPSDLNSYHFANYLSIKTDKSYVPNFVSVFKRYLDKILFKEEYFKEVLKYSVLSGNYIMFKHFDKSLIKEIKLVNFNNLLKSVADKLSKRNLDYGREFIPTDFYINLFLSMFEELSNEEKIERFKKNKKYYCFYVLTGLLDWPYQNYFLHYADLMWEILKFDNFVTLLQKIIERLSSFEGRVFNYSSIFKKFWDGAPKSYKAFVCGKDSNHSIKIILSHYAEVDPFTHLDIHNIKQIFQHITEFYEHDIIVPTLKDITETLVMKKRYRIADIFLECYMSPESITNFKYEFIYSDNIQKILKLIAHENADEAVDLIKWCVSLEKDINDVIEKTFL